MSDDFRDALIHMAWREIKEAKKSNDIDRGIGVIATLAEILGKSIAMVGYGDREAISEMLPRAEYLIADTAKETGEKISLFYEALKVERPQKSKKDTA